MTERHADPVTMQHIVELRAKVAELEKYLINYEKHYGKIRQALGDVREIIRHSDEPREQVLKLIDATLRGL